MKFHTCLRSQPVFCPRKANNGCIRQRSRQVVLASIVGEARLVGPDGSKHTVVPGKDFCISTEASADLCIIGTDMPSATMSVRSGRAFLKVAAPADDDDIQLTSGYYVDSNELRPGVAYMLTPGAIVSFGSPGEQALTVDFEEPGNKLDPMFDAIMKGMAQSDEVRRQLEL